MSSQTQEMRKYVDQLRQEAGVERLTVSTAIEEMVIFMNQNATGDGLVNGLVPNDNPFRDQKGCVIL